MADKSDTLSSGLGRPSRGLYGSDLMVEVLRELGIRYIALNPGASYRGLHDSLVNFGPGEPPEIILCTHEEIAVALANGYTRATGEPMATALHNVVGLLHASMAIFNAWCDRTPMLNLGGGGPQDAALRRSTDWVHTALVQGNLVRDFVKYDDQPYSLESVPESLLRAYRIATTEPKGPVYVCLDADLQEQRLSAPCWSRMRACTARRRRQRPIRRRSGRPWIFWSTPSGRSSSLAKSGGRHKHSCRSGNWPRRWQLQSLMPTGASRSQHPRARSHRVREQTLAPRTSCWRLMCRAWACRWGHRCGNGKRYSWRCVRGQRSCISRSSKANAKAS